MINADYELLSVSTDDGERYAFSTKEKMFAFLREMLRELCRNKATRIYDKPFIFKGTTR